MWGIRLIGAMAGAGLIASAAGADTATPPKATGKSCVDVRVEGEPAYYKCLNEQLQGAAKQGQKTPKAAAPLGTQSPSNEIGGFNDFASRERMGNAFGKSAVPQRPVSNYVTMPAPAPPH